MLSELLKELRLHYPEETVMQFLEEIRDPFDKLKEEGIKENAEAMQTLLNASLAKFCPKMSVEGIYPVPEIEWAYDDREELENPDKNFDFIKAMKKSNRIVQSFEGVNFFSIPGHGRINAAELRQIADELDKLNASMAVEP